MACALLLVVVGCASDGAGAEPSGLRTADPGASPLDASPAASASIDPEGLCRRIDELELSIARLRAIDLKLTNRVPLDIELAAAMLAFDALDEADLGEFSDQLEHPLQRLAYSLTEVELAVEDFRTNPRPRRAEPHVQEATRTFAEEVDAFRVLARC
jgi:hypothetical protein